MDCVVRFPSCASFRSLVGDLRRVRLLPASYLVSRLHYPPGATVTRAVVNAVDGSIVPPPRHTDLRETRTPISIASPVTSLSSCSPLEFVLPDEKLHTEPLSAAVFVNEAVRFNGWRLCGVIEFLVYLTSASQSKLKTLSVELNEAKRSLAISDEMREALREEIDRIISRNRGDGERDVVIRCTNRRYRDENEEDVRDRDTRDWDCGISIRTSRILRILTDLTNYGSTSDTYGRWNIALQRVF